MRVVVAAWRSTVGRKALVAVSGLALWVWVVLHVLGNLTLFSGPVAADAYAAALHRAPAWLWAARVGLAVAACVHIVGVVSLARVNRAARPRHEVRAGRRASTLAARSMRIGGVRPAWIAGVYLGAALLLGLHLYHGLWAAVRSLGIRPDTADNRRRPAVALLSAAVTAGFASIPIAVFAGWLR
jgi:succinate dehydrogenase / fumarate reductase cytochrome b subunit